MLCFTITAIAIHTHGSPVMRNKDGAEVVRQACGTKMEAIGWLMISAKDGSVDTGLYVWGNSVSAPELLGLQNDMTDEVEKTAGEVNEKLTAAVPYTSVDLRINDPEAADENGRPIRIVRRAETNLGDLCADACLDQSGADIAFVSGGCVRVDIPRGGYHHEFRPDNFVSHLQITNKRMKPRRILQDIKPEDCWAGSEGQITAPDRHRSQSARHS